MPTELSIQELEAKLEADLLSSRKPISIPVKEKNFEEVDADVVKLAPTHCVVTEIAASNSPLASEPNNASTSSPAPADIAAAEPFDTSYLIKNKEELNQKTWMFDTYIDLMSFFHDSIQKSEIRLHRWQVETGNFISQFDASITSPLKFALCASNGSGKDSFCIAPLAVWFILCKLKSRVVITSSSGTQLTSQTETYIKNLCETINSFLQDLGQPKAFKINQRYIRCLYTGSEIRMYATDEPGKAEGYHPMEPNAPFLIIVNEAKSVDELIFQAISRCTGFSHKVYVSSPGEPKGSFHRAFTDVRLGWFTRRVTSYDCTHIPRQEIETDKIELGEYSAVFRSKHLALFTTVGGTVVINEDVLDKCKKQCTSRIGANWPKRVGIDLAAGGDECVIDICQGNMSIYHYEFVEKDTTITASIIDRELTKQGIEKDSAYIRADDGGVGRGIIDQLVRMGWTIQRILNQSPARDKRMYGNKGAEMWFRFSRLVEECLWLFTDSDINNNPKLMEQLIARHYRQSSGGSNRLFLQDKKEAKAEGHPSPDRADARVLANCDLTVEDFLNATSAGVELTKPKSTLTTLQELVDLQTKQKYAYAETNSNNRFDNAELVKWSTNPESILQSKPPTTKQSHQASHSLSEFI